MDASFHPLIFGSIVGTGGLKNGQTSFRFSSQASDFRQAAPLCGTHGSIFFRYDGTCACVSEFVLDHVENAMGVFPVVEITDPLLWISMVVCRSWKQSRSPHPSLISLDYLLISMRVGESSYTGSSPSNGCAGPSVKQGCVIYAGGGELVHRRFAACGVGDAFRGRRFRHPHSFGRFRRRYIRHLRGVWGVS